MGLRNRRLAEETPADEKKPLSESSQGCSSLPWGVSIQDAELENACSPWVTPRLCLQGGDEEEEKDLLITLPILICAPHSTTLTQLHGLLDHNPKSPSISGKPGS